MPVEGFATLISNAECNDWLKSNSSRNRAHKTSIQLQLKNGINDQLLCSVGIRNETTDKYPVIWKPFFCCYYVIRQWFPNFFEARTT